VNNIFEIFDFSEKELITIIGSGGKTTTFFELAHFLVQKGKKVITTTTTKIFYPTLKKSSRVYHNTHSHFCEQVKKALKYYPHITLGNQFVGGKIHGFSAEKIDNFFQNKLAPYILVEGDGARGKSLKAYAEYEPVIPLYSTWVFVVVGIDILGKPLNETTVHRSSLLEEFLDLKQNDLISLEHLILLLKSPYQYQKNIPSGARRILLLNKADCIPLERAYKVFEKVTENISLFDIVCLTSMKNRIVYKYWRGNFI